MIFVVLNACKNGRWPSTLCLTAFCLYTNTSNQNPTQPYVPDFTCRQSDIVGIDECAANNGGCSSEATCTNTIGSFTCTCLPGYSGDGLTCEGKSD